MQITLFMAISLNGMIARPDYREDFLSAENWDSFLECARRTGSIIWGRKTHEKARAWGAGYLADTAALRNVVVSSSPDFAVDEEGWERADSPQAALEALARQGRRTATLAGGSILNSAFAREGLIDEVVLNVEAVVVARGIPLFAPADIDLRLELADVRRVGARILQLHLTVSRP